MISLEWVARNRITRSKYLNISKAFDAFKLLSRWVLPFLFIPPTRTHITSSLITVYHHWTASTFTFFINLMYWKWCLIVLFNQHFFDWPGKLNCFSCYLKFSSLQPRSPQPETCQRSHSSPARNWSFPEVPCAIWCYICLSVILRPNVRVSKVIQVRN